MQNDPFDEDLSSLWQKQETAPINAAEVMKTMKKMKRKQIFYVVLDALSVIIGLAVLLSVRERFSDVFFYTILAVVVISGIYAAYITYLRRFAVLADTADRSVKQHLTNMLAQAKSNVRIARYTQISSWLSWLMLIFIWLLFGFLDEMPQDEWLRKLGASMVLGTVILAPMYVWARKRETKFRQLAAQLEQQQRGFDDAGN
ncbi:hypothetical protein [Alteromonas facilis]|uniref:hypothetical protein n=1 Tax=Alteromonas facilis TaxID=2048004 RepID=UPI000C2883CA|nr:hypothetical protein [Alteromonas facilis]